MTLFASSSMQTFATSSTTNKLKKDKGIQRITRDMCFYASNLYCMYRYTDGVKVNVKMNATNKFYIVGMLTTSCYHKYNEEGSRNFIVEGESVMRAPIDMKFMSKLYQKLFGSKLNISKVEQKNGDLIIRGKKCYAILGDFGVSSPTYSISKITKVGKNTYSIKAKNIMKTSKAWMENSPEKTGRKTIGTTWITVKKDKSAPYGYKVIKFSYKLFDS